MTRVFAPHVNIAIIQTESLCTGFERRSSKDDIPKVIVNGLN